MGYRPITTYEAAVGASCDWLARTSPTQWREAFPVLASYSHEHFDYAAEDAFLERQPPQKS
jgi:hypothetical protein